MKKGTLKSNPSQFWRFDFEDLVPRIVPFLRGFYEKRGLILRAKHYENPVAIYSSGEFELLLSFQGSPISREEKRERV